jgi:hypothetical protein
MVWAMRSVPKRRTGGDHGRRVGRAGACGRLRDQSFSRGVRPLGGALKRVVAGGNEVQVLVTARAPDAGGRRVTYLIEVSLLVRR